jgi:hypothetical protein
MLDRFCLRISLEIHDKIKWFNLESSSMKPILLNTNYPNLDGLGLYGIEVERAKHLFTSKIFHFNPFNSAQMRTLIETVSTTRFICTVKNQISFLVIDISKNKRQSSIRDVNTLLFIHILIIFTNL